jgi:hypothetical protein
MKVLSHPLVLLIIGEEEDSLIHSLAPMLKGALFNDR